MAAAETQALWAERIRAWRARGQSAEEFADGQDFQGSTLRRWGSRLRRLPAPRFVELVTRSSAPAPSRRLMVAVGAARIEVEAGFDPHLLAAVIDALGATR